MCDGVVWLIKVDSVYFWAMHLSRRRTQKVVSGDAEIYCSVLRYDSSLSIHGWLHLELHLFLLPPFNIGYVYEVKAIGCERTDEEWAAGRWQNCKGGWWTVVLFSLCVGVQVYESKLQELQKQVETISLVAETPDEEELEEEEEEEGLYWRKTLCCSSISGLVVSTKLGNLYPLRVLSLLFLSRAQSTWVYVFYFGSSSLGD